MLEVKNLSAGYGDIIAVRDISFSVQPGEIFALMGANGAGKSSTLMSLMGLVERKAGEVILDGEILSTKPVEQRISNGLAIVPEGRRIFPDLSVHENLIVGGHTISKATMLAGIEEVYEIFPRLLERQNQQAGSLSGGEQQMLAMGRALISQPKYLIVDELSLGLMPKVVDECYEALRILKGRDVGILLVEQNTERVFANADNVCVLEAGNTIWTGSSADAANDRSLRASLMGVH
ncbi:MAG: branched-chain amino acid transport system ATP-binding protein [Gammaproteobacteria bacterium]|jgi:branched-chain amino acid transport system ATP-binding protein